MSDIKEAAAVMGRKGGKSTSEAKQKAVRDNGKKGGRPRKDRYSDSVFEIGDESPK